MVNPGGLGGGGIDDLCQDPDQKKNKYITYHNTSG